MLKKAISVALLSGFIAGLFVTVIQSVLVTPLILEAESYEQSASAFQLPDLSLIHISEPTRPY